MNTSGIDVHKLAIGIKMLVRTQNSLYRIEKCEDGVIVEGGKYFPQPIKTRFLGSNFGGSMLKIGWIGFAMSMEFVSPIDPARVVHTSPVCTAKIIGNGWEYEMEWS